MSSNAREQVSFLTQILWSQTRKFLSVNLHISISVSFFFWFPIGFERKLSSEAESARRSEVSLPQKNKCFASEGLIISWLPSPDIEVVAGEDWNGRDFCSLFIQYFGVRALIVSRMAWRARAILKSYPAAASKSKPPLLVNLRKGLRMKFSGCSSAAFYAAFETRLKQCSVTSSHSATSVSCMGHHWPIYIVCFTLENVRYRRFDKMNSRYQTRLPNAYAITLGH